MAGNGERVSNSRFVQLVRQVGQEVVNFSSQYGNNNSRSYSAHNLAGPGYSYPNYGDFVQAFVLRTYGPWWHSTPSSTSQFKRKTIASHHFISQDFVDVYFEQPVYPKKIHILETYNPGAVVRILCLQINDVRSVGLTSDGRSWVTLWSGPPQQCPAVARSFSPNLKMIDKPTRLVRLEFNQEHLEYYTELDGLELMGNVIPGDVVSVIPDSTWTSQTSVTVELFRQLSLTDRTPADSQRDQGACENVFFDILPSEVIHLIFSYLELTDLTRAASTCRLFFLHCYDPVWFKELDLQPHWTTSIAFCPVDVIKYYHNDNIALWDRNADKYFKMAASGIVVPACGVDNFRVLLTEDEMSDTALEGLQTRCATTERLNLSWAGPYGAITSAGFQQFLSASGRELVCLRLAACAFVDDRALYAISSACPDLQELDLSSCMSIDDSGFIGLQVLKKLRRLNLYRTNITDDILMASLRSCPGLQHLNVGGCSTLVKCDEVIQCLTTHCRDLVSLDLWRNKSLSSTGVVCLSAGCIALEELDIGWCTNVVTTSGCIEVLTKGCGPRLKKLFMAAIRSVNDYDLNAVAENCPDLEQLDVLGTALVSRVTMTRVMEKCPKLKFVDMSFCSQLTKDFVDEMRTKYTKTSIKKSFVTNGP